jgi:serine O-acetyltransferase
VSKVILFLYRVAMQLRRWHVPLLPVMIQYASRMTCACHIALGAQIGRRTHLAYGGLGTVIHSGCVIGENVYIGTNVTIGGRNGTGCVPVIKNNCFIGSGAKLLGDITVGPDAVIGVNAVVLSHVPERSCAAGVPAKIIKTNIDLSEYRLIEDMMHYSPQQGPGSV